MVETVPALKVNEIYGPVAQGEGPWAGRPQVFLRLAGCNLNCVWCDTPYSWDWTRFDQATETHKMTSAEVAAEVAGRARHDSVGLCITGGEPMVQGKRLGDMLNHHLVFSPSRVSIETNGTRPPTGDLERAIGLWVVSPKLANSEIPYTKRIKPDVLDAFAALYVRTGNVAFKFVVEDEIDLNEVVSLGLPDAAVWIMPQARTGDELLRRAADLEGAVLAKGWSMTLRRQVLLHGDRRGV